MIFKIAKTELRNLFYSPVAWFLTIAFLIQCAVYYSYLLSPLANWQDIMATNNPKFKDFGVSLTQTLFLDPNGIFANVLQNLYLFVPMLTMGLISREINNGTIKLLFSSPVKTRDIVFGKYLAIMIYNVLLLSIVGIFMVSGLIHIQSADYGMLLSAGLGFYLLVCAYTAIGLFMSSLTTYQIVSAIGSFTIIFILSHIGSLWQKYDFVRDLTYFLSISGRTAKMLEGLIVSKDVIYFVLIVGMFLAFTLIKMRGGRESKPWYIKTGRYISVIVVTLLIGYASSRPTLTGYWDTTYDKVNTLHENTQKIVRELGDDPLEVTLYCNLLGLGVMQGFPEARNQYLSALWEHYTRFKPDITFKYVYYYDVGDSALYKTFPGKNLQQIGQQMANGYDADFSGYIGPAEIRKMIDPAAENYRLVMQLKYKGHTTFLRTYDDAVFWPEEKHVAAAFKRLMQAKLPKVFFATGDLERSIYKKGEREFWVHSIAKSSRQSLINLGFDSDTLSLTDHDIPGDITALVLADPKTELSAGSRKRIAEYIDKGGNMLILGEPGKQQLLNPVLRQLGVQLMDGTLVELSKDEMPHMVVPYLTAASADLAQENALLQLKKIDNEDSMKWVMPGATSLTYTDTGAYVIKPLLMTVPGRTWLKRGTLVTDSAAPVFSPEEGDIKKPSFPVVLGLTRQTGGKEQRIVVGGDADFMSTLRTGGDYISRAFYSWMDYGAFPIYTPRPKPRDNKLNIGPGGAAMMKVIYIYVLPGLVLLLATVLLIRRKRK